MKRAWAIARKEWAEVFKNRFVLFTVAFLPLLLTALPLVVLFVTKMTGELGDMSSDELPAAFATLCGEMSNLACGQYFLVSQFLLLFMLLPLAIPVTFASYSIIGEKTTRTLEPVLATPVSTIELLAGKALAAATPAVAATWLGYLVFVWGASKLVVSPDVLRLLLRPLWIVAVFIVGPLLSLAAVSVAVMVSSRANDPRVAEQMSMFVMLPLLFLFFGQMAGLILLDEDMIIVITLALIVIDAALLGLAVRLFQRETILTRWK